MGVEDPRVDVGIVVLRSAALILALFTAAFLGAAAVGSAAFGEVPTVSRSQEQLQPSPLDPQLNAGERKSPWTSQKIAQGFGFHCVTQYGVCPIPPTPLGYSCFCGQYPGYVVP